MAKIKTKPIKANWKGKNWPWFPDHPKKRKIIWIVTYWLLRPDEDDPEEDFLLSKPIQALFDWAEEIATSSQIFDYGLRLKVVSRAKGSKETAYTFVRPDELKDYLYKHLVTTVLPEFHIRFIDTDVLEEWFLADFVPHIGFKRENPWVNFDPYMTLYQWGISGLRALKLADLITKLFKKFYENSLSINEINFINQKANKARIVTLPNLLVWKRVVEMGGYVGPSIEHPESTVSSFPIELPFSKLTKLKNDQNKSSEVKNWLQEITDYTIIRDCETLLFLELKDLLEMYGDRRCKNTECKLPLPLLTDGKRYTGNFCHSSSPNYWECLKSRNRQRKFQQKLRT